MAEQPGVPAIKYQLEMGDLKVRTEISSPGADSGPGGEAPPLVGPQAPQEGPGQGAVEEELGQWRERRLVERMAASSTWEEMGRSWTKWEQEGDNMDRGLLEYSEETLQKTDRTNVSENQVVQVFLPSVVFQIEERLYPATLMVCSEVEVEGAATQEAMDRGWVAGGESSKGLSCSSFDFSPTSMEKT